MTVRLDLDCGIVGEYTGANVIGEVTGRKYPDQVVAIGGHLDSWDPGTGAIDDGAGVAIAMAAAKLIRDLPQRPDRTIRVIAFANEEMACGVAVPTPTSMPTRSQSSSSARNRISAPVPSGA